jgi:hypothetical protein
MGVISVIASEAKQSTLSFRGEMDCFATLAMTVALFEIESRKRRRVGKSDLSAAARKS